MRFKFFPGSELGPPTLLGGIVDLDRPQHLIANLFINNKSLVELQPIVQLNDDDKKQLEDFAEEIPMDQFCRVPIQEVMHYTTRHRAMC